MAEPNDPIQPTGPIYATESPKSGLEEGTGTATVVETVTNAEQLQLLKIAQDLYDQNVEIPVELRSLLASSTQGLSLEQLKSLGNLIDRQLDLAEQSRDDKKEITEKEVNQKQEAEVTLEQQKFNDAAQDKAEMETAAQSRAAVDEETRLFYAKKEEEEKAAEAKRKQEEEAAAKARWEAEQDEWERQGAGWVTNDGSDRANWQQQTAMLMALDQGFVLSNGSGSLPVMDASGTVVAMADGASAPTNAIPVIDESGKIVAVTDGSIPAGSSALVDESGKVVGASAPGTTPPSTAPDGTALTAVTSPAAAGAIPAGSVPIMDTSGNVVAVSSGTIAPAGATPIVDASGNLVAMSAPTVGAPVSTNTPDGTEAAVGSPPLTNVTPVTTTMSRAAPDADDAPVSPDKGLKADAPSAGIAPVTETSRFSNVPGFFNNERLDALLKMEMVAANAWGVSNMLPASPEQYFRNLDNGLTGVGGMKSGQQVQLA